MNVEKINWAMVTTVEAGESWYSIGRRVSVNPHALATANGTNIKEVLHAGRILFVPGENVVLEEGNHE